MKKTFAALSLAAVMLLGSTLSFAGIIISDSAQPQDQCTQADRGGIIIFDRAGIIISDFAFGTGTGIIIFDATEETCSQNDRGGIIISD